MGVSIGADVVVAVGVSGVAVLLGLDGTGPGVRVGVAVLVEMGVAGCVEVWTAVDVAVAWGDAGTPVDCAVPGRASIARGIIKLAVGVARDNISGVPQLLTISPSMTTEARKAVHLTPIAI